jgi:protein-disulfide isomerase
MSQTEQDATLTPPVSERDHRRGSIQGKVTLVEYGDFECPDCGRTYPNVKELLKRMQDRVSFVFRNYPLSQHPHAEHAAEAAEAAGAQGKFWEMHDYLFEHQRALSDHALMQGAQGLGLDIARFEKDMEQGTYAQDVEDDIESGDESGVEGTPTFYINGVQYEGPDDVASLQAALDQAAR